MSVKDDERMRQSEESFQKIEMKRQNDGKSGTAQWDVINLEYN